MRAMWHKPWTGRHLLISLISLGLTGKLIKSSLHQRSSMWSYGPSQDEHQSAPLPEDANEIDGSPCQAPVFIKRAIYL